MLFALCSVDRKQNNCRCSVQLHETICILCLWLRQLAEDVIHESALAKGILDTRILWTSSD